MGWKFDHEKLADDLKSHPDAKRDHIYILGNMIIISQVRSGTRTLQVHEFLEIVETLGEHPATYIVEVGRE